jgi:signal transduction histidine kinase
VLAHIFEFDPAAFEGRALADTPLPKPLTAVLAEAADAALAANGVRRARVSMDENGETRSFSVLALPTGAGRSATVALVVTPTSHGASDPIADPARQDARTAQLRAETALFMRDHVLGLASHDLRGPLNAIHSWGYVLERKVDANDPAAARALAGIRSGVEQQVKLIEQIIDTTRSATRALPLERAPVALRALLDQSVAEAGTSLAARREVTVVLESELVDEQIDGDAERLSQALWLMLAFGTEASTAGSTVSLRGTTHEGFFDAAVNFTVSRVALVDPDLDHVLETFARTQSMEPREAARVAWALALAKRVAEAHGGTFVHDDVADGAAVTFKLHVPLSAI